MRLTGTALTLLCALATAAALPAQGDSRQSTGDSGTEALLTEVFLHPVDGITPYTLDRNELIYAQSIQTLPFPSWGFLGLTENLTVQLDFLPWIFGFFSEVGKPIPSLNARYRFNQQRAWVPTIGLEAMFVYFWEGLDRFSTAAISVRQAGAYAHLKPVIGYRFGDRVALNLSIGLDYTESTRFTNVRTGEQSNLTNSLTPNASVSFGYRAARWASVHVAYSYGATLTYLENVPAKHQLTYGARIAPFLWIDLGILNAMRVEFTAINAWFPAVDAQELFPLPVFPYLYWQWKR